MTKAENLARAESRSLRERNRKKIELSLTSGFLRKLQLLAKSHKGQHRDLSC